MSKKKSKNKRRFSEKDFVKTVWETMQDQEKNNPALTLLHERLSPEFEELTALIQKLFQASSETEQRFFSEIVAHGKNAVLPLLDFCLQLKKSKH